MDGKARLSVEFGEQDGRYSRQELITWWDQSLLADAQVLVVGAGALGNELTKCLALLGVGSIMLLDFDRVERSNLSRGVFLREKDIGQSKAVVVAKRARSLNPDTSIEAVEADLQTELGVGRLADFDVILGGVDSRLARLRLNALAYKAGVPYVDGAIDGLIGIVRVFLPAESPCYECSLSDRDLQLMNQRRSCALLSSEQISGGRTPTTVTMASVVAATQVQEAVKLIHDAPGADALVGRGFVFNGITHDSYIVEYERNDLCLAHDSYEISETVSNTTKLSELIERAHDEFGEGGFVQLEHEVVTRLDCSECDFGSNPNLMAARLDGDAIMCPDCGATTNATLTNRFGPGESEIGDLALGVLALPPRDVVSLYDGAGEARLQLEIEEDS